MLNKKKKTLLKKFVFTDKSLSELKLSSSRYEVIDEACPVLLCRIGSSKKIFCVRKNQFGRTIRVTLGDVGILSIEDARIKAMEMAIKIHNGINPNYERHAIVNETTFNEFFETYMRLHSSQFNSPKAIRDKLCIYKYHFHCLKNKHLSEITRPAIASEIMSISKKNGIHTANRALTLIRHVFNKAIEWGWDGVNPATHIPKYRTYPRERFLVPDEFKKLYDVLDKEDTLYKVFFLTLLYTGQRRGNVMTMRWEDIDFTTRIWFIPRTKNGTSMRVPLVDQLIDLLNLLYPNKDKSPWVFPSPSNPSTCIQDPKRHWANILKKAGISNLRIHDLRRTVGSYEAMSGISLPVISRTLNHKSLQATQIYARADIASVERALQSTVNVFEGYRQGKNLLQNNRI